MAPWRQRLHEIIFEADTPAGKAFDVALLIAILLSVMSVSLETVDTIDARYHVLLESVEWLFTILFTIEYILRLICVRTPRRYVLSFYGIIDLVAVVPTYLTLVIPGAQQFLVIRALRLLRVFRIFKLGRYLTEATALREAIWASRAKVTGEDAGFDSIPQAMYWAVVTMTTVGYGDIAPLTPLGKALAAIIMVLGYSFIIVPTGIVSAELAVAGMRPVSTQACPDCSLDGHDVNAKHCKFCGTELNPE
ncbi:MAG: ion transporter [Planctomycetota bacterium]|jgi:voltage-gated potassium channel